ncbi:MAG: hypothetical protein HXK70_00145 [Clostridiales bacterium]|jgi:hypothetical protein|nr:hypothetical protein [Clostridiales bacterium]
MGNQWIDLVPRNTLLEYYRTIVTSNNVFLISMAIIDLILVVTLRSINIKDNKKYKGITTS